MISINEDLWLNDWHESVLLADRSISSERVGSLINGNLGWESISNLEDSSPFSESTSHGIILSASLTKSIESGGGSLIIGSSNWDESAINLNSAVNVSSSEDLSEFLSILGGISNSLIVHDDSAYVLINLWGGEKELSVSLSVVVVVLDANSIESLSNGSSGLVSSEDSLSWSADFLGSLDEFFLELS